MIIGLSAKKQSGKDTVCAIIQWLISNKDSKESEEEGYRNYESFKEYFYLLTQPGYVNTFGWQRKLFADKLKDIVCLLINCTREQLEDQTFKETPLGEEWKVWFWSHYKLIPMVDNGRLGALYTTKEGAEEERKKWTPNFGDGSIGTYTLTPRKLLQLIGTDCMRNLIHPNVWVNALMSGYKTMSAQFITMDLGASNEQLEKRGKIIESESVVIEEPNWIISDTRFPNEAKAIKDRNGLVVRINRPDIISNDNHPSETSLDGYKEFDYIITNNGSLDDLIIKVQIMLQHFKLI